MKKVLVTGAAGYIGSVVVRQLLARGYAVRGVDALFFGGDSLIDVFGNPAFEFIKADLREHSAVPALLAGVDAVIHLAAIVGDPACAKDPVMSEQINWEAAKNIFDHASVTPGLQRFVFASTCSNYGKMEGDSFVNEESPLNPVSLYAKLKVQFENYLMQSPRKEGFYPVALRFATVYGASPRLRFDLTVNEFMRDAFIKKELVIFGEQFWRPYCHVDDLAGACIVAMEADASLVDHEVFGVGDTAENYQKKMLADEILKFLPNTRVEYVQRTEDPRDYRVDFTKISTTLGFKITKRVPDGLAEIHKLLSAGVIDDPYSQKHRNI